MDSRTGGKSPACDGIGIADIGVYDDVYYMQNSALLPAATGYFSKILSQSQQEEALHIELFAMISAFAVLSTAIISGCYATTNRSSICTLRHCKSQDNPARWVVELQNFDITIEYRKWSSDVIADRLSRNANPSNSFVCDSEKR
ncbi:hypothetical protein TELCIR_09576 [Teladorsagia circumcincta]|uniref:Uncharacterized protein n=1 Tax=Teladorsagia circumcincta TaxID=45464 RepID=A0A2G9UEH9_TELCI|nr:hypothetical protein TELCIR_09576 [Teladorsagia circumcincta]